ncbi:hypothetical protein D9M68_599960 [compost metagenome]
MKCAFEQLRQCTEALLEQNKSSTLTISTLVTLASKWLLPRLAGFQEEHPNIDEQRDQLSGVIGQTTNGKQLARVASNQSWSSALGRFRPMLTGSFSSWLCKNVFED